jgi:hypothetical protein
MTDKAFGEYTTEEVRALSREMRVRHMASGDMLLALAADVLLAAADGRVFPPGIRPEFDRQLGAT